MLVDQGGVGQRPEMFGGLQFGRVRRSELQMQMVRHLQPEAGVPPRTIQHENDLLVWAAPT